MKSPQKYLFIRRSKVKNWKSLSVLGKIPHEAIEKQLLKND